MFPFRSKVKELQKTIATLEEIIADNRHVTWKQYVQLQETTDELEKTKKEKDNLQQLYGAMWNQNYDKTVEIRTLELMKGFKVDPLYYMAPSCPENNDPSAFKTAKDYIREISNLHEEIAAMKGELLGARIAAKQEQAMNETVEISKLRGEISILKEELQRIKIVAEREKERADAHSDSFADLQEELEATIKQRDELDREITCLHDSAALKVETEREHLPGAPAHCKEKTGIDAILAEREKTHGSFETHANCTQILEDTFYSFKPSLFYNSVMREGLHMIFHKLGRIAAGCATHKDHWDDIAGYATLVSRSLENLEKE